MLGINLVDFTKFSEKYNRGVWDKERYDKLIEGLGNNFLDFKEEQIQDIVIALYHYCYYFPGLSTYLKYEKKPGCCCYETFFQDVENYLKDKNPAITNLNDEKYFLHHGCFFMSYTGNK